MRINLVTPFAEKDAVKALGARWDAANKVWFIQGVADLTPFMRWIPARASAGTASDVALPMSASIPQPAGVVTRSTITVTHCGCQVLPWADCPHSAAV